MEIFEKQDQVYKDKILPKAVRSRVAIEASATDSWYKYVGLDGAIIGLSDFGKSAPGSQLYEYYGFSVNNIVDISQKVIKKNQSANKKKEQV